MAVINLTFEEETRKNEISEYCYLEAKSLWVKAKNLILKKHSTPFLIITKTLEAYSFQIQCEEDDSSNFSIFDEESILIYPTRFQEWVFHKKDENFIISEISKNLEYILK